MGEGPVGSYDDHLARMRDLMVRHGWAVQGVEGDRLRPPYAYTVGLTDAGLPELVVTGMPIERAGQVLNGVAELLVREGPPPAGERMTLPGGLVLEVVAVEHPAAHLDVAVALCGPGLTALQLAWTDGRGRWPWERGSRGRQTLLGPRLR